MVLNLNIYEKWLKRCRKTFLPPTSSHIDLPKIPDLDLKVLSYNTDMLPGHNGILNYSYTPQFKYIP